MYGPCMYAIRYKSSSEPTAADDVWLKFLGEAQRCDRPEVEGTKRRETRKTSARLQQVRLHRYRCILILIRCVTVSKNSCGDTRCDRWNEFYCEDGRPTTDWGLLREAEGVPVGIVD